MEKTPSSFTPIDRYTARSAEGFEVHLPGPYALRYSEPNRFVTFDSDIMVLEEVLPLIKIFYPKNPTWTSSGEPITERDFNSMRENIIRALQEFTLYGVFINPDQFESH
jgi:hypothetical protein